jgi:ParB/RepB/Spo0J family partition protein
MEIGIESISVRSNPRSDFGDIDELTASVREKGVIEPLVVKDLGGGKFELVAGERRLRASKAAGLEKVPVNVYSGSDSDIEEVKLIENIQRKDLNPVEEAEAFQRFISETKASVETLAQKMSKPKIYVERRLALLALPEQVKKAVIAGKVLLGHALLISRLKNTKEQLALMKKIVGEGLSVGEAESHLGYKDHTVQLQYAEFDKKECAGCRHNGGEQAVLFESGSQIKGVCLDKRCFLKKQKRHRQDEVRKLQKRGVKVLSPQSLSEIKAKERVDSWQDDYKAIQKKLAKEPENYVVVFGEGYSGQLEKQVWCVNPKARHPKKDVQESKQKAANTADRLKNKVAEHKRGFLIGKTQELIQPGTKESKALTLFALLEEGSSWNDRDRRDATEKVIKAEKIGVSSFGGYDARFSKILELEEADIDRIIAVVSGLWVKNLHRELVDGSEAFGVSLNKHFVITEDYLKPHTKDQLVALTKEIGLDKHLETKGNDKWDKAKKADLIKGFLESGFDLKGKVPKLMEKTR